MLVNILCVFTSSLLRELRALYFLENLKAYKGYKNVSGNSFKYCGHNLKTAFARMKKHCTNS